MAYKTTTAIGFRDLVRLIRNFVCGYGDDNPWVYTGPTALSAQLLWFGAKPQGVGGVDGVTAETWTFTCTTGGGVGVAKFSVSGSISGPQAELTAGTYYDESLISAYILIDAPNVFTAGGTPSEFTIEVTGNSATQIANVHWQLMYEEIEPTGGRSNNQFQFEGKGLSDDKTINIMLKTTADITDQDYVIRYMYATGYLDEVTYDVDNQPGTSGSSTPIYQFSAGKLSNTTADITMPVHLFCNKQRFIAMNESAAGRWHGAYAGFFYPYGSPGQYPFPCYIGANSNTIYPYTSDAARIGSFVDPGYYGGRVKEPGGGNNHVSHENSSNAETVSSNGIWPFGLEYSENFYEKILPGEDGSYPMFPVILREVSPRQMLGELDGVCAFPNVGVAAGSIINDGVNDWVVFKHPLFGSSYNYFAVRID